MTNLAIRVLAGILLLILWTPTQLYAQSTKLSAAYSAESSWSLATWVAHRGHSRDQNTEKLRR